MCLRSNSAFKRDFDFVDHAPAVFSYLRTSYGTLAHDYAVCVPTHYIHLSLPFALLPTLCSALSSSLCNPIMHTPFGSLYILFACVAQASLQSSFYQLGSPGKSGSQFFITSNGRYIIKTLKQEEFEFLLSILLCYLEVSARVALMCRRTRAASTQLHARTHARTHLCLSHSRVLTHSRR